LNSVSGQPQIDGRRESFGSHNSQTAKEYEAVPKAHDTKLTILGSLSPSSS